MPDTPKEKELGIVLTADGSANNQVGYKGWGFHGYLYSKEDVKKGSGCPTHILTETGYLDKREKKADTVEVLPLKYFDGYGSSSVLGTNNVAELEAATNAMAHAAEYNIRTLKLYSDSQYVVKGFNHYLNNWKNNGWVKSDGQPVMNQPHWHALSVAADRLANKDVKITVEWVKGHNGDLANESADRLAGIASLYSSLGQTRTEFTVSEAQGYWKHEVGCHPFLIQRSMYFNSNIDKITLGEYYLGDHGKDDELIGKRSSDGHYSVVILKEPDPALELVRQAQAQNPSDNEHLVLARIDQIYKADVHMDLMRYGSIVLRRLNPRRTDLTYMGRNRVNTPITRELQPVLLAMRSVENLNALRTLLDLYKEKSPNINTYDITDHFFVTEIKEKKKKNEVLKEETTKLNPKISATAAYFPVTLPLQCEKGTLERTINLTAGVDIIDRNTLKRIESMHPRVILVTWQDAPDVLRYATIVEVDNGIGVWAGVYSNIIFMDFSGDPAP